MRRRKNQNRKLDLSYSQEADEDSMNQDYVVHKRAKKKVKNGPRAKQKINKKNLDQSGEESNQGSQIIQFKHRDEELKEHYRPSFIQRWNGVDNQIQIYSQEYKQMSPMFKVYWETKSKNMNAVVFLQFGKMEFFAFENDAILLHEIFKKKLKHFSSFLMVNFWCREIILAKQELFDRNVPVLMMNQIDDPAYKANHGLIRREINEVITPGLHLEIQDKAYKERWFMGFFVVDINNPSTKNLKRLKKMNQDKSQKQQQEENETAKACVTLLDSESNNFFIQQFQIDQKLHQVRRVLNRYRPVELLIPKSPSNFVKNLKQIARQICAPYINEITYEREHEKINITLEKFMKQSKAPIFKQLLSLATKSRKFDEEFQMYPTVKCLDLIYEYLSNLKLKQKIFDEGIFSLSCFKDAKMKPFFDSQVYQNLQVFRIKNQDEGDGKKGTLVGFLDLCHTNSGKKLLRRWLNEPLTNIKAISQRQQCLKEIVQIQQFSSLISFHQRLIAYEKLEKQIADIYHWVVKGPQKKLHRLTSELSFQKGYDQKKNPAIMKIKQVLKVLEMLEEFEQLLKQLQKFKVKSDYFKKFTKIVSLTGANLKKVQKGEKKLQDIPDVKKIINYITEKIVYDKTTDYLQPAQGTDEVYDEEKKAKLQIQEKLDKQLEKWKQHFKSTKLIFTNVRARNQIQVPKSCIKSRKDKPKELIFSSQTANAERFTTATTIKLSEELIQHQEKMARSYEPFLYKIIDEFCTHKFIWGKYVEAISELDVIFSLAHVCRGMFPRCIPTFVQDNDQSVLQIKQGKHPGLIQVLEPNQIVSNSLQMNHQERFLLLTGPNMGGKSTLLRQTCLLAIMAQIGCYVPCQSYKSIIFDQIFCRIGSSDRIIEGKSTFYVELEETNRILKQATSSSLVIIDQLGRGTSTYDGMAIAEATIQFILNNIGCYTLFSTHYTPITKDFVGHKEVRCGKMSYKLCENQSQNKSKEGKQKLEFLYQVVPGVAQKSFANNVARMVGLPAQILEVANEKAEWISELHNQAETKWKRTKNLNHLVDIGILRKNKQEQEVTI